MPGIRFDDSAAAYAVLTAIAILVIVMSAFTLNLHLSWASRVRRLLEHEGFTVRRMERRWLTRGPFPDLRPPGVNRHTEWLIRVDAVDREHRPRAGWVRWRKKWPWDAADTWTVRWDDAASPRTPGLSTGVFMALVFPPSLAGLGISVYLIAQGIPPRLPQPDVPLEVPYQQAAGAPASVDSEPGGYEIRCRGGGEAYRVQQLSGGPRMERGIEFWRVLMSLKFTPGTLPAGNDGGGLAPGTCAWIDRPLNDLEPREIRFEPVALVVSAQPKDLRPLPGMFPSDDDLRDPAQYWSFSAFNTNQGFLQATSYRRWTAPTTPVRSPTPMPPAADTEIVQRFVCERSYSNYAWGYQHSGIYVDRSGDVYRFSVRDGILPRLPSSPTEAEMTAKYGQSPTLIGTVPAGDLLAMFRLIAAAAKGKQSERVSASRDRGALVSSCYLFDAIEKRYREVELDVQGDWKYRNLAPEAVTLTKWLASLDRPLEKK
jgi:hypothetical protein